MREEHAEDQRLADLALVLRADSYKFHNSGYYATHAADDYTALFGKDPRLREFMGRGRWIVDPRSTSSVSSVKMMMMMMIQCHSQERRCRILFIAGISFIRC